MTDTATAQPRIDPRFARRWIEVQRANGRRRLHLLLAFGAVVTVVVLAAASVYTPIWKVRHIRVTVTGGLNAARIETWAHLGPHPLMIDVDAAKIAARLNRVPVLGGARVARQWPGTVTITVAVRRAVALIAVNASQWAMVDPTGRVIADLDTQKPGIPLVVGVSHVPAPGGWIVGSLGPATVPGTPPSGEVDMNAPSGSTDVPGPLNAALAVLQAIPTSVRPEIISVNIGSSGTLSMTVLPPVIASGSVNVALGDGSQLNAKLDALVTLLTQADLSKVAQVDLTVPDRPTVLTAR